MKRLLMRMILLAVFSAGGLFLINTFCVHSNIYRNVLAEQGTLKFETVPEQIKFANFGSSHGYYGFCYENTDINTFNFALTSQSLIYDRNILDFYQDNIAEGATILIPISFSSFYSDELKKADFKSQNARYYTFLDKSHIRKYDAKYGFIEQYCWILTRPNFENLIVGRKELAPMLEYNDSAANMGNEQLRAEGKEAWKRHWKNVSLHKDYQDREERNIAALVSIIDLCNANGFIPVLITTPFLNDYSRNYSQDFLDSFYGFMDNFSKEHNIIYLDYAFDERFINSPELFINSDHLNKKGALMFTDIVMKDLSLK